MLFVLVFLGGVVTIASPCVLPVLPFVFARADQPFIRSGLPTLFGMTIDSASDLPAYRAREAAHTVAVDPQTHLVYVPLENVGGRPVLWIMGNPK
jgi:hypothetical protein